MDVATDYDHLEVALMEDPFALLADARQRCPVAHTSNHEGYWTLFRYADVAAVARDPGLFSSASGVTIPHHGFPLSLPPIESDPPQHMEFRGPLLDRFSPGAVARFEPALRAAVREFIGAFIHRGEADLAQELTIPLPGVAVSHLLSIPSSDTAKVRDWTTRLIQDVTDFDAIGDAMEYFAAIYDDRCAHPVDDIPSLMLTVTVDGRPIAEEEYLCMMSTLVMAGLDTTANAAAGILQLLGQRPELRASLQDRELLPTAIEELLRYITPLPALGRVATADTTVGDHAIAEGERVQLNWIAANHDPAEFPEPDAIRLDRSPNRHFAFGAGPHRCLGAHLARLELRIVVEEVLDAIPDYQLVPDGVVRYAGITRGISSLPVTFTPRP